MDFEVELERSTSPDSITTAGSVSAQVTRRTEQATVKSTGAAQVARQTSSAEYIIGELKRHKVATPLLLGLLLLGGLGLGYGLYSFLARKPPFKHFQQMKITKLTSSRNVTDVVISPDGKYIVYDVTEGGRQGLWAKYLPTGSTVQIVPPAEVYALGSVTFSNDGNFVYYSLLDQKNPTGTIFQVPVLGGTPKK